MATTIYKLFIGKMTEAWHQLPEREQHTLLAEVNSALDQVGGKRVLMCNPSWCTEQWHFWGVEEFPNFEAIIQHTKLLANLNWERYVESTSFLGTSY